MHLCVYLFPPNLATMPNVMLTVQVHLQSHFQNTHHNWTTSDDAAYIDGWEQDCGNSMALAMELLLGPVLSYDQMGGMRLWTNFAAESCILTHNISLTTILRRKGRFFVITLCHLPADTLRNNDAVITSKRYHFDVITSKWRRFDVITTSL